MVADKKQSTTSIINRKTRPFVLLILFCFGIILIFFFISDEYLHNYLFFTNIDSITYSFKQISNYSRVIYSPNIYSLDNNRPLILFDSNQKAPNFFNDHNSKTNNNKHKLPNGNLFQKRSQNPFNNKYNTDSNDVQKTEIQTHPLHQLHQLHPRQQLSYYKKLYSEQKKYKNLIFNPYPAIPKQSPRLHYLYNISTGKIDFKPQFLHLPKGNRSLRAPKFNYYHMKTETHVKCDFTGKVFGIGMFKTGTSSISEALGELGYHSILMNREPGLSTQRYWDPAEWFEKVNGFYGWASDDISWLAGIYENEIIEHVLVNSDISFNFGDGPWLFGYHLFDQYYSVPPEINYNIIEKSVFLDKLKLQENDVAENEKELKRNMIGAVGGGGGGSGGGSGEEYNYGKLTNLENGAKFILTIRNSTWDVVNSDVKMAVRNKNRLENLRRKEKGLREKPIRS